MGFAMLSLIKIAVVIFSVFGVTWIGYATCVKEYKKELAQGKYDLELWQEQISTNEKSHIGKGLSYMAFALLIIMVLGLFIAGVGFKINNKHISINGNTVLVVKTGSMSNYYDSKLEDNYKELGYNDDLQFAIGDVCFFEEADSDLKIGEVYAYNSNGILITHRLIGTQEVKDSEGNVVKTYYVFRGDNNPNQDQVLVTRNSIVYHYTGNKIPGIGSLVLFAQSYTGLWSLICMLVIIISSDYVIRRITELNEERIQRIGCVVSEQN